MKTAIIKTTIWEDDTFFKLNIDTKLIFWYFLSNPNREIGRIFRFNKRMCIAYTGLSSDQIDLCVEQLQNTELIELYNGYVYLNDTSYTVPKSGRFTSVSLKRELLDIPTDVLEHFGIKGADKDLIENIEKYRQEMKLKSFRDNVFSRLESKCCFCGSINDITIDHILPLSLGGNNDIENLQILCGSCNSKKGVNSIKNQPENNRKNPEHINKDININNNKDNNNGNGRKQYLAVRKELFGR